MIITDGEKTMTLEELAEKICESRDCGWDESCPFADNCWRGHNGLVEHLRGLLNEWMK